MTGEPNWFLNGEPTKLIGSICGEVEYRLFGGDATVELNDGNL